MLLNQSGQFDRVAKPGVETSTNLGKELEANCLNANHHVFPVNQSHVARMNESIEYALCHSSCSIQIE
jgi:hypothetical protein